MRRQAQCRSCLVRIAFVDILPNFVAYIFTRTLGSGPSIRFFSLFLSVSVRSRRMCLVSTQLLSQSPACSLKYSCCCANSLRRVIMLVSIAAHL